MADRTTIAAAIARFQDHHVEAGTLSGERMKQLRRHTDRVRDILGDVLVADVGAAHESEILTRYTTQPREGRAIVAVLRQLVRWHKAAQADEPAGRVAERAPAPTRGGTMTLARLIAQYEEDYVEAAELKHTRHIRRYLGALIDMYGDMLVEDIGRRVGDVDDQVGERDLLQRRAERLHEVVGQLADEPDRVRDHRAAPTGELDLPGAAVLEDELARVEAEPDLGTIVLDLRGLEFMDSSGLRLVVTADLRLREAGRRLVLVRGDENVQRVFEITRMAERLTFVDDPEAVR